MPIAVLGLGLVAFAVLAPRRFAAMAITLSMVPVSPALLGFDPRIALVALLLLSGCVQLIKNGRAVQFRVVMVTAVLAATVTVSFITTLGFRTELLRANDLALFLMGLLSLVLLTWLRLPFSAIVKSIGLGGLATATLVLARGEFTQDGRLTDVALNSNFLGLLLATALIALVGMPLRLHGLPRGAGIIVRWMAVSVVGIALALTQSRGAVLAASVGLIALFCVNLRLRSQLAVVAVITVFVLTVPGLSDAVTSGVVSRPREELATNNSVRLDAALLAVHYAVDHPVTGVGYGTFADRARTDSALGLYINTHNDYLRLAAEAGLPSVAAFLFLVWPVVKMPRASRSTRTAFAVAIGYLVGLLFANSLTNLQVTMPFWAVLASMWATRSASSSNGDRSNGVHLSFTRR